MTARSTLAAALAMSLAACGPFPPASQSAPGALREAIENSPCDIVDIVIPLSGDTVQVGSGVDTGGGAPGGVLVDHGFPVIVGDSAAAYIPGDPSLVPDPDVVSALTGSDSWENEAHDCQRLILETTIERPERSDISARRLQFGPLVGIFPLARAMIQESPWSHPRPVATIYNWGDWDLQPQPYAPLFLTRDWHCLWMMQVDGTWHAAILPSAGACPGQSIRAEDADWRLLEVVESRWVGQGHQPGRHGVYPRTARWGWDAASSRHYIGIKCGDAWCSIGQTAPPVAARLIGEPYRVVPGWYDEQPLAISDSTLSAAIATDPQASVPVASGPNRLKPGPAGALHPDSAFWYRWHPVAPDQRQLLANDHALFVRQALQRPSGLDVARIELTGNSSTLLPYQRKFSLMSSNSAANGSIHMSGSAPSFGAKFRGNGDKPARVVFVAGSAHSARGAVRWRWSEQDEKAWVSCENGCCTIAPQ